MATPAYVETIAGHRAFIHTWTITTADHTGAVVDLAGRGFLAVQFHDMSSSWGSATAAVEGSIDGTLYFALKNRGGSTVEATDDALFDIDTPIRYLRPRLTTVGTAASVVVSVISKSVY